MDQQVHELDADEGRDQAAESVDQDIAPQQRRGPDHPVATRMKAELVALHVRHVDDVSARSGDLLERERRLEGLGGSYREVVRSQPSDLTYRRRRAIKGRAATSDRAG
jgi:hypothetical protein